jgi:hypothetical protein
MAPPSGEISPSAPSAVLAPIPLRTSKSYELQRDAPPPPPRSAHLGSRGRRGRSSLSPPRGYHSVSRGGASRGASSLSPLAGSFIFDERASLPPTTPSGQRVSRRYFFRGLEHEGTGFPAAGHYDVIVPPPPGRHRPSTVGSDPATPPDAPPPQQQRRRRQQERRSLDYVDTLVSAVASANSGECNTVRVCAEDLAEFIKDARPFAAPDARPMFLLARDLLQALVGGQLDIVTRESEALAAAMATLQGEKAALESQLADQQGGITAKLRRVEARLEAERAAAEEVRTEREALAKEAERVTRRLRRYEPDTGGGMSALRRTKTVLSGMQNYLMNSGGAAAQRREGILANPVRLHSAAALIDVLSQDDRWQLLRVAWKSFGLPAAAVERAHAAVAQPGHQIEQTQVDLKLFVRSKTGAEKREVIDQLAVELGLNNDSLPELIGPYTTLLGGSAEQVELMRSLGQRTAADAVIRATQESGEIGVEQPTGEETAAVLGMYYRLAAGPGLTRAEQMQAVSHFGLCMGESMRRKVLEGLRGGVPLPDPLPAEPDQLSSAEQQMLLAQLLTQHDIEADEFVEAAVAAAERGGPDAERLGPVMGLLGRQDVSAGSDGGGGGGHSVAQLAAMLGSGLSKKRALIEAQALKLVVASTQTDPIEESGGGGGGGGGGGDSFEEFMARLQRGELSAEEMRALGLALIKHADAQQLHELLSDVMSDGRACSTMKAIVSQHEVDARAARAARQAASMKKVAKGAGAFGAIDHFF